MASGSKTVVKIFSSQQDAIEAIQDGNVGQDEPIVVNGRVAEVYAGTLRYTSELPVPNAGELLAFRNDSNRSATGYTPKR